MTYSLFTIYYFPLSPFSFFYCKHHQDLGGWRLDRLDNLALKLLRLGGAGPTVDNLSVTADQELFEVPLDPLQAKEAWLLLLQPLV